MADPRTSHDESADTLLDRIRDEPDPASRDRLFERLVAQYPPEELVDALRRRLDRLEGHDGEAVLRLLERFAAKEPDLLDRITDIARDRDDLSLERLWLILDILDDYGRLVAEPDLAAVHQELAELANDATSLDEFARQIEEDPESLWIPLTGLSRVEPELVEEILTDLGQRPLGTGHVDFLRLLTHAHDSRLRSTALRILALRSADEPGVADAWNTIAETHHDPNACAQAGRWLESAGRPIARGVAESPLVASLVTAVDGKGRGAIVLEGESNAVWTSAVFLCDVLEGIVEVIGQVGPARLDVELALQEAFGRVTTDHIKGDDDLALKLLAGCVWLGGPGATPALRFWLERTAGPGFRAEALRGPPLDAESPSPTLEAAEAVLNALPTWIDRSHLTCHLAEQILLRESATAPDPVRDAGGYRFLFEHHLKFQLDRYSRMLFWMAAFWTSTGDRWLAAAAGALAEQLVDDQHAVPAHPFVVALTSRSLAHAMTEILKRG